MAVHRWLVSLALAGAAVTVSNSSWGASVQTLFLAGQPAPAGLSFASFGRAALNSRGNACFFAGWDSLRHRPEGLFLRLGGQVLPVVRAGDPVPDHPEERFSFPAEAPDEFTDFSLNDQDQVAFVAQQGLYLYSEGMVRPLARVGDPVPGFPDEVWDEVDAVSLNNAGTVAFVGAVRSTDDGDWQPGVFEISDGSVNIALFAGDALPELDSVLVGFSSVVVNDAGELATLAQAGDDAVNCILLTTDAGTRVLAAEGEPAPGGVWTELDSAALNQSGTVVFQARLQDHTGEHGGIYRSDGDTVTAIAVPGQAVSSAGGAELGDNLARPVVDNAGNVAFLGSLAGPGQPRALVSSAGGQLSALAIEGKPGPGELKGTITRFSGLNLGSMVDGTLVCGGDLQGGSVQDALLKFPASGMPGVILTTADPLPPGGTLTLIDGQSSPSEVEARTNANGDVIFAADVGGYGRALFRVGADGPILLTPLGQGIRSVSHFDLNDAGQIVYRAARDEADKDMALFTTTLTHPEVTVQIAASGDPAGSDAGQTIRDLGPPRIDAQGAVLFAARAQGADGSAGKTFLLHALAGQRDVLAAAGQPLTGGGILAEPPDVDPSADFSLFRELQLNRQGEILFLSSFQDGATGSFSPNGLFLLAGGMVRAVALPGQPAPLPSAPYYSTLSSPHLSDSGDATFAATVIGPGRKLHAALFRMEGLNAVPVATAGDPAPGSGAPAGALFRAFLDPAVNAAGDVAFYALLDPPSPGGAGALFLARGAALERVLPDTDLTDAATGAAVQFDNLPSLATLDLRDDGSILVAARLRGASAPQGLFLVKP